MSLSTILQEIINLAMKIEITEHVDKELEKKTSIRTGETQEIREI